MAVGSWSRKLGDHIYSRGEAERVNWRRVEALSPQNLPLLKSFLKEALPFCRSQDLCKQGPSVQIPEPTGSFLIQTTTASMGEEEKVLTTQEKNNLIIQKLLT